MITGVALFTEIEFVAVAAVALVGSDGVKLAERFWVPAASTVPEAGE
jgi:hypothetical protein